MTDPFLLIEHIMNKKTENLEALLLLAIKAALKAGESILEIYEGDDFDISIKDDNSPLTKADREAHNSIINILQETEIPILSEEGRDIQYNERSKWTDFWLVDPLDGTKEFIKRNDEFTVNIAYVSDGVPVMGVVFVPVLKYLYFSSLEKGAFLLTESLDITKITGLDHLIDQSQRLPINQKRDKLIVVGSRSHMSVETEEFIENLRLEHNEVEIISKGSSLKLCMVAEGNADIYPRFGPTMEWDTAAGHAIVLGAQKKVTLTDNITNLKYNKENLLNPWFIVS